MFKLNFVIFLIICGLFKCEAQYCKSVTEPPCSNNNLNLCDNTKIKNHYQVYIDKKTRDNIKYVLWEFRDKLQKFLSICNLKPWFTWNEDLESLAANIIHNRAYRRNCFMTKDFKNICVFEHSFNAASSIEFGRLQEKAFSKLIESVFVKLIDEVHLKNVPFNTTLENQNNSWLYSAYSNEIGCSFNCNTLDWCKILCLINGIELKYFNQSFGYGENCVNHSNFNDNNVPCFLYANHCKLTQHFICNISDKFVRVEIALITFTDIKFILNKLEFKNRNVSWNYDLQHLAMQIVFHNLTEHEKCLAQARYKVIKSVHFMGIKHFSETISNIDYVWERSNQNITDQIGCAIFDTDDKFNIYCLFGTENSRSHITERSLNNAIKLFLESIKFNETDKWILYGFIFNVYGTILAIILFIWCKKSYEIQRFLYTFDEL